MTPINILTKKWSPWLFGGVGTALALLAFSCGGSGSSMSTQAPPPANTIQVGQGGFVFAPAELTVKGGTVITFQWAGSGHSVVVGPSCGSFTQRIANVENAPFTATFTTPTVATNTDVPFHCEPHCGLGMTGVIHVTP